MPGSAYVAFGGMNMYTATGRDNYYVGNHLQGFLNNARWHRNRDWARIGDLQQVADNPRKGDRIITSICSTVLNPNPGWKREAAAAIRASRGLIALLARDPRRPPRDKSFSPSVRWEIAVAAHFRVPVYVMRRRDANWMTDDEVVDFVNHAARHEANRDGRRLRADLTGPFEGWDESTWVYPGLSGFLDRFL